MLQNLQVSIWVLNSDLIFGFDLIFDFDLTIKLIGAKFNVTHTHNLSVYEFAMQNREKLRSPRVLSCLHVFCEECIDGLIEENADPLTSTISIECPDCNQPMNVSVFSL